MLLNHLSLKHSLIAAMAGLGLGLAGLGGGAQADPAEFYRGKTITVLVGSGAGGGYDTHTRILIRHMADLIPGQPRMMVQNMPGASGMVAINHLAAIASRDGTVFLGAHNTLPLEPLMGRETARFDPAQLSWVGSIGKQTNVCIMWHESSVKTLYDVFEREVLVSSTGASGWRSIMPRLYNATAGSRFRVIEGYDTTGSMLALERREVDGICTTYETLASTQQDWLQHNRVTFIAQFGLAPLPDLPGVPRGLERLKNPEDLAAIELVMAQQEFGRPYVAPPEVPADRLAALRSAFDSTMRAPAFLAEAGQAGVIVNPMTGREIEDLIRRIYASPEDLVARSREIMARVTGR